MNRPLRLPVEEAIARILAAVAPLPEEHVPVRAALGRVLAASVTARYTHPAWRNSAMDGYAVRGEEIRGAAEDAPIVLQVAGTIAAGDAPPAVVLPGTAWRIMTGAPVPDDTDTVIRVEDTDAGVSLVRIHADRDVQRNVRPRGEDFEVGESLLSRGTLLRAAGIGLAAANGLASLPVIRKPRVAILTSGNELVDVDGFASVLAGHRIVNTNGYTLGAAVEEAGGIPIDLGIAPDDPIAIAERITQAPPFDALITCGGISVGAFDYTRDVVQRLGARLDFWRVRMRPGGPFGFGVLDDRPWFGLPGNPVSALVTFEVFARPALQQMGLRPLWRPALDVTLAEAVTTGGDLTHFLRAVVDAEQRAHLTGPQGSGLLTSMHAATALVIIPSHVSYVAAGTTVRAVLLAPTPPSPEVPWTF